jgi:hypothetical protein
VQPPRPPVPIGADGEPGESREEEGSHGEPRRRWEARPRGSHGGFRATTRDDEVASRLGWCLVERGGGDRVRLRSSEFRRV